MPQIITGLSQISSEAQWGTAGPNDAGLSLCLCLQEGRMGKCCAGTGTECAARLRKPYGRLAYWLAAAVF